MKTLIKEMISSHYCYFIQEHVSSEDIEYMSEQILRLRNDLHLDSDPEKLVKIVVLATSRYKVGIRQIQRIINALKKGIIEYNFSLHKIDSLLNFFSLTSQVYDASIEETIDLIGNVRHLDFIQVYKVMRYVFYKAPESLIYNKSYRYDLYKEMFDFFAERKPKHNVEFDSEFYKEFNLIPLEKTPNLWDEFYKKFNINSFEMEHPDEPFVREFNKVFYETFRESFKDEGGEQ